MKAQVGDYVKYENDAGETVTSCVFEAYEVTYRNGVVEEYTLTNGDVISELDLSIDDIFLESEVCYG